MANNYSGKQPHGNVQLAYNPGQAQHYAQPSSSSGRPQVESKPRQAVAAPQPPPQQTHQHQHGGHASYQSKYGEMLNFIEEIGKEVRPTYAGSKMAQERLKKNIMHARALVRECLAEVEKSARQ
ncbi:cyclin-dependent kinase 2-associated protein 1-like [Clytia hemisphaerica]|uniref:Uncharacterized protein n=1 Tax=Clytia hemisphaerica TaxID=252671 RepID=A0A7M5WY11_9CNID|eukprot:TCONS_00028413-protein